MDVQTSSQWCIVKCRGIERMNIKKTVKGLRWVNIAKDIDKYLGKYYESLGATRFIWISLQYFKLGQD